MRSWISADRFEDDRPRLTRWRRYEVIASKCGAISRLPSCQQASSGAELVRRPTIHRRQLSYPTDQRSGG